MPVFCPFCGYENPDRSTSCGKCNSRFSSISDKLEKKINVVICPFCGYENPDRSTSCGKCNSRFSSISEKPEKKTPLLICPQCGFGNPDSSVFCIKCGSRLISDNAGPAPLARPINRLVIPPTEMVQPGVLSTPVLSPSTSLATSLVDASQTPAYSAPLSPVRYHHPTERAPHTETPQFPVLAPASEESGSSSRRYAFAGRGTPLNHHSWLIEGCQTDVPQLRKTIAEQILQRRYPGVSITSEHLTEHGANQVEGRDYLTVQRGYTSAFIYIASQGSDLYISRATTVHTPIRWPRVCILLLLLLALGSGPFILNTILFNSYSIYSTVGFVTANFVSTSFFLEYVFAPLYAVLVGFFAWAFLRSGLNWFSSRDFWIYLRSRRLQDFQADDVVLLERAIDQVLRASVARLGIDSRQITPPVQGYQFRPHLLCH